MNIFFPYTEEKLGLGSAYKKGFSWGIKNGFQYIVEMDADFSHRLIDLDNLIENANEADLVLGSRLYIPGGGSNWFGTEKESYCLQVLTFLQN